MLARVKHVLARVKHIRARVKHILARVKHILARVKHMWARVKHIPTDFPYTLVPEAMKNIRKIMQSASKEEIAMDSLLEDPFVPNRRR